MPWVGLPSVKNVIGKNDIGKIAIYKNGIGKDSIVNIAIGRNVICKMS